MVHARCINLTDALHTDHKDVHQMIAANGRNVFRTVVQQSSLPGTCCGEEIMHQTASYSSVRVLQVVDSDIVT